MLTLKERYLTDDSGNRVAVVLDLADYERLIDVLEDYKDLSTVRAYEAGKAAGDPNTELIPWAQAQVELEAHETQQDSTT